MAWEIPGFDRSWIAGGSVGVAGSDLSVGNTVNGISIDSYRYMFVQFTGGLIVPMTSGGVGHALGVLQNKPLPGSPAAVRLSGVTRVRSDDASITVGTPLYVDQYGFVVSSASGNTKSTNLIGIAEEVAATSTGYMIAVCLKPFGALGTS